MRLKTPTKKYINIQQGVKILKPSISRVNYIYIYLFIWNAFIVVTYIFSVPISTTIIITFKPCVLNIVHGTIELDLCNKVLFRSSINILIHVLEPFLIIWFSHK